MLIQLSTSFLAAKAKQNIPVQQYHTDKAHRFRVSEVLHQNRPEKYSAWKNIWGSKDCKFFFWSAVNFLNLKNKQMSIIYKWDLPQNVAVENVPDSRYPVSLHFPSSMVFWVICAHFYVAQSSLGYFGSCP